VSSGRLSIRSRAALIFGIAAALLTAAALVTVALVTQAPISVALSVSEPSEASTPSSASLAPPPPAATDQAEILDAAEVAQAFSDRQWTASLIAVVAASVVAGLVGWLVTRRLLAPIDAIVSTAERIGATTLHERINLTGPRDELWRLGQTFDDLLARLEASFEAQARFISFASHELKTPLAVQRALLQIDFDDPSPQRRQEVREHLLDLNRRGESLVNGLLQLTAADRGSAEQQDVHLDEVIDEVLSTLEQERLSKQVELTYQPAGAQVLADPVLLRQLIWNLLDNAVEYTPPGGAIEVTTSTGSTVVCVVNDGPVIDDQTLESLPQPFMRGTGHVSARDHHGLGLALVSAIARTHGWTLTLRARPEGGIAVSVETPLRTDDESPAQAPERTR